jgi:hypothetical protein
MSYTGLLKHRCTLRQLNESIVNGIPQSTWVDVQTNVKCFLDLNFIRRGKDPMWTMEAGRPSDRSGVLFVVGTAPVKSGQRVQMTFGPSGTFLIEGAVDEAWRPTSKHHIEVGVVEVPSQISKGQGAK